MWMHSWKTWLRSQTTHSGISKSQALGQSSLSDSSLTFRDKLTGKVQQSFQLLAKATHQNISMITLNESHLQLQCPGQFDEQLLVYFSRLIVLYLENTCPWCCKNLEPEVFLALDLKYSLNQSIPCWVNCYVIKGNICDPVLSAIFQLYLNSHY